MTFHDLLVQPKLLDAVPGTFTWPRQITLATARDADLGALSLLATDLSAERHRVSLVRSPVAEATVRMKRVSAESLDLPAGHRAAEGYRVHIYRTHIEIHSAGDAGAFYGVQFVRQFAGTPKLRCARITDYPDFARRGVYLDCSRGKVPTVATLKDLAQFLARLGINELQLYIENTFAFERHPLIGEGYSPLTSDELREIQAYCAKLHISFVPSLSSFGHMERILALPPYRKLGELPGHQRYPGGTTLNPLDPRSVKLLGELYDEFLPLFSSPEFNACGDEPWELGKGKSKSVADKVGVGRVYLEFIKKLRKLAHHHGKRLNLWGDIVLDHPEVLPELPKDIVMLNWEYSGNPEYAQSRIPKSEKFRSAGLEWIACPGTSCWNRYTPSLKNMFANIRMFGAEGLRSGAAGLLNTDWGDGGHRNFLGASLLGFAYGAAHSWHSAGVRDEQFLERFTRRFFADQDASLARAIRLMEGAAPDRDQSNLYHLLMEPAERKDRYFDGIDVHSPVRFQWWEKANRIDEVSDELCYRVLEVMSLAGRVGKSRPEDPFFALAVEEVAAGGRLLTLAASHGLCGKRLRNGTLSREHAKTIAGDFADAAETLANLWMARNKPSRLRDNLLLLNTNRDLYQRAAKPAGKPAKPKRRSRK